VYFSKTGFKFNKKLIARQKLSDILQAVVSEYRQGVYFSKTGGNDGCEPRLGKMNRVKH
jgi:hypothetical protein